VLNKAGEAIQCGVTTDEIDAIAHNACVAAGAYPSPLLYRGFPKSICTSVNNVACHGIPDDRPLCDGDIVNVDVTVSFLFYTIFLNICFMQWGILIKIFAHFICGKEVAASTPGCLTVMQ